MRRALTIAALALVGAIPSAGADSATVGSHIVFVSDRRGTDNLYMVEPDGGAVRRLTAGFAALGTADVSPDGKEVGFTRGREGEEHEIWTATMRGGWPRRLTRGGVSASDAEPAWSPDGQRLAFVREDLDGRSSIYVVERGGGRPRLVTRRRALTSPSWSPDGKRVALADESAQSEDELPCGIVTIGSDGSDLDDVPLPKLLCALDPDWSPDGSEIVFTTGLRSLYAVRPDGRGLRRVVRLRGFIVDDPVWSPDGRRVAFTAADEKGDRHGLMLIGADGRGLRRLTRKRDVSPSWISPREIAFVRGVNLWRTDLAGRARQVTKHYEAADPALAPSGSELAFATRFNGRGKWALRTMDATGRSAPTGLAGVDPTWAPDGSRLAFERGGLIRTATRRGANERWLREGVSPAWSPDGSTIAYTVLALHIVSVERRRVRMLTPTTTQPRVHADWSPDGLRIAYTRFTATDYFEEASPPHVYVVHRDGSRRRLLIRNASEPAWSPDGSHIAFVRDGDIWVRRLKDGRETEIVGGPHDEHSPDWGRTTGF